MQFNGMNSDVVFENRGGSLELLSLEDQTQVCGGITRGEAGMILAGYGTAIVAGATVGALMGGPGGMLAGAFYGAARVAIGGGIVALGGGAWRLRVRAVSR